MSSLKQFIRNVRAAKTIADERAVVQKESAAIRASFREESHDSDIRRNNVAKLLYLFTLGERTHFGQIECLKLLASPRFADKRLGYLGTMLLLDENQEVLTLVTNSLSNDLNHSNQYVVGLALCALGNIASIEMSRDLFTEIGTLVSSSNSYIRRKAALCAMRICRKVPDLREHFVEKAKILLADKNHGVLLCGLTLVISMCEAEETEEPEEGENSMIEVFRPLTPSLVKILKTLASSGYAPEHDVTGVTDPFLQVKILRLLRVLGRGDARTSELVNDILAQVATNTDSSKNVGNSILYEAVLTILDIEADSGLRVLGVNILGKFLSNKDNNIRYVALNTLIKVVAVEPNAVQRHRNTVLDCLRDPDISIRRRALDLSFTLVNETNVRVLIRELLAFLEVADNEFKPVMTTQIGIAADRYAPNKRWHVDTMLRVLKLVSFNESIDVVMDPLISSKAGSYVREQILSSFVRLIATTPELQTYSVRKLYASLKEDPTQEGLSLAGSWVIGEFGDALLRDGQIREEDSIGSVRESDVVDLFITILNSSYANQIVTEYIMTAAMKLTTRLSDAAQIERLRRLLTSHQADLDIETQQRAVEYVNLFSYDQIRRGVLERMPPPEIREEQRVLGEATKKRQPKAVNKKKPSEVIEQDMLLDLMGGSDMTAADMNSTMNNSQTNTDLLADILGGDGPTTSTDPANLISARSSSKPSTSNTDTILDLFGSNASTSKGPVPVPKGNAGSDMNMLGGLSNTSAASALNQLSSTPNMHQAYNNNNLQIQIQVIRGSGVISVSNRFLNTSASSRISKISLQAAVPRSQRIQLQQISSANLGSGEQATQQMRVTAESGALPAKLRLRIRLSYEVDDGTQVAEQIDWNEPA